MPDDHTNITTSLEQELLGLQDAVIGFFTSPVSLPDCPKGLIGQVWWEEDDEDWTYPWRISGYNKDGCAFGYPCGEPIRSMHRAKKANKKP